MRLGFAVKVLGGGGLPSHDTRRWQSGPDLSVSLDRLEAILAYLDDHDIRMYRMATGWRRTRATRSSRSSAMRPLATPSGWRAWARRRASSGSGSPATRASTRS
jgi:hypothetical protein